MGCPAGIGPEIILRYWQQQVSTNAPALVVLGDLSVLTRSAQELGLNIALAGWCPGQPLPKDALAVYELSSLSAQDVHWGTPTRKSSQAMVRYIQQAVALIQSGILAGMVTCPISKEAMHDAGYLYPGHTEMLAELTHSPRFMMMMAGKTLKVTLATIHCRLSDVSRQLTQNHLQDIIRMTDRSLKADFALPAPRIALAGLNPHAGENGLFGDEEKNIITPAILDLRKDRIDVSGPYPPDTVFYTAVSGAFDAVVAMYHDQGLIPFKLLHFKDGVNVTCGLPIVRTSVDHGTAYAIAGKGVADCASLSAAVAMAREICTNRSIFEQQQQDN